jgi:predicted dehydrogenase
VLPDAKLVAVGSRSAEKAAAFGAEFGAERCHASYEALAGDRQVDAVYVATPHPLHAANSILCLQAGKAVLCEKPFTVNAAQAREVIGVARACGVFCMEAMWTRFLPVIVQVREWLAAGAVGEPRMLTADFGFRAGWNPASRLLAPELAGGSLLDVGVYVIALALMVFGRRPSAVTGLAHLGETGVDEQAAFVLGFDRGELAVLSSAVRTNTPQGARIDGTDGRIAIDAFWHASHAVLSVNGREPEACDRPLEGTGYNYEAAEVGRCLRAGLLESDVIGLDETLAIMETMDTLRAQWGLRYPCE